jgi:hypothetical protein
MRYRLRTLLILVAVFSVFSALATHYFATTRGRAVTAAQANRRLWNCSVPLTATDVWFQTSYRSTKVDFKTDEQSFREWCSINRWKLQPVASVFHHGVTAQNGEAVNVSSGLFFKETSQANPAIQCYGVYDAATSRAFLIFNHD